MKDLSKKPLQINSACPECGTDLNSFFNPRITKQPQSRTCDSRSQSKPETLSIKPPMPLMSKKAEIPKIEPTKNQIKQDFLNKTLPTLKHETTVTNKNASRISGCKYYFGYLANREKQNDIPEICLICSRTMDCMRASANHRQ